MGKLISIMEELINYKFGTDREGQYGHYLLCGVAKSVRVHPAITSLMNECRKMYKLMATYMQSYQIAVIFRPIVMQFEMKLTELIGRVKQMHLGQGHSANINANNQSERKADVS